MHTEILLSRGETVTSFELPAVTQVKVDWPEAKKLRISVPFGLEASAFTDNYQEILHPELVAHLQKHWPEAKDLQTDGQSIQLEPWSDLDITVLPKKAPKNQAEIDLDRPRITIQMGQRVDEFSENCGKHLKPELFEHVIKLWSDPDYCRTVLPIGRNLLIRGCA